MSRQPRIELTSESILFADDDLIAVDKAPGVLCDASIDPGRDHLGLAVRRWAHSVGRRNTDAYRTVHRLDLPTSGVVLFACTAVATTALMRQFQNRSVSKHYLAIVDLAATRWGPGETVERRSYLRHHQGRTEEVRSGGKPAESSFQLIDRAGDLGLVEATPRTGRTHQLRVHLAALNAPILGDDLYGRLDATRSGDRLWLHAHNLAFVHPRTEEPLELRSRSRMELGHGEPMVRFEPGTEQIVGHDQRAGHGLKPEP